MPVGRQIACPKMLKIASLSSSLVVVGSSSSISFFSPGRRGSPSPWLDIYINNSKKNLKKEGILEECSLFFTAGQSDTSEINLS